MLRSRRTETHDLFQPTSKEPPGRTHPVKPSETHMDVAGAYRCTSRLRIKMPKGFDNKFRILDITKTVTVVIPKAFG